MNASSGPRGSDEPERRSFSMPDGSRFRRRSVRRKKTAPPRAAGAALITGADTTTWSEYGALGAEWSTQGGGIL